VSILIDLAALLWLLGRQVRTRPLKESYKVPIILGIVGLFEFGAFALGGGQQLASFLKGQRPFATIPDGRIIIVAVAGSLPRRHYGRTAGANCPAVGGRRDKFGGREPGLPSPSGSCPSALTWATTHSSHTARERPTSVTPRCCYSSLSRSRSSDGCSWPAPAGFRSADLG
jgi:hypothetical protein